MNAATVNGPRSWIAALIFLDGDEDFTIAAPEQDLRDVPGGYLPQLAFGVGGVRFCSVSPKPLVASSSAGSLSLFRRPPREACSASRSSSSTVTFSVLSCLFRITLSGTVVPGFVATTILTRSSLFCTGRPLYSTMTSPGSTPALDAAAPAGTCVTSAPMRDLRPNSA